MRTKRGVIATACAVGAVALWLACGDKIFGEKDAGLETGSFSYGGGAVLVVPDSVPVAVDEAAVARAFELRCSWVRILQLVKAGAGDGSETYYVTYFEDGAAKRGGWDVKEHRLIAYDPVNRKVGSLQPTRPIEAALPKSTQVPCWLLAWVFKDAKYEGDKFQFSQATGTSGYYHKVIWDLNSSQACCEQNYPGGFNDCISSHMWPEDCVADLKARPIWMKAWKHANRRGPNQRYDAICTKTGCACYDYDWSSEYWGFSPESVNDKGSSIDMYYTVMTY